MTISAAQRKLFDAARVGDKTIIRSLVFDDSVDFDLRDEQGRTAFHIATQNGQADTARTILAAREARYIRKIGAPSQSANAERKDKIA